MALRVQELFAAFKKQARDYEGGNGCFKKYMLLTQVTWLVSTHRTYWQARSYTTGENLTTTTNMNITLKNTYSIITRFNKLTKMKFH